MFFFRTDLLLVSILLRFLQRRRKEIKAAAGSPTGKPLRSANSPEHLMDSKFNSALRSRRRPSREDTSPLCTDWKRSQLSTHQSVFSGNWSCVHSFQSSCFLQFVVVTGAGVTSSSKAQGSSLIIFRSLSSQSLIRLQERLSHKFNGDCRSF